MGIGFSQIFVFISLPSLSSMHVGTSQFSPVCSSLWSPDLHQELIEHKQSHTSVAVPRSGHFVSLKWFTRWDLKTFRDVIPGKELPRSYFKLLFIVKAILNLISLQLFFRNSCLFYPVDARICGFSLFPSHKPANSSPGSSFLVTPGAGRPTVTGTHRVSQQRCLKGPTVPYTVLLPRSVLYTVLLPRSVQYTVLLPQSGRNNFIKAPQVHKSVPVSPGSAGSSRAANPRALRSVSPGAVCLLH